MVGQALEFECRVADVSSSSRPSYTDTFPSDTESEYDARDNNKVLWEKLATNTVGFSENYDTDIGDYYIQWGVTRSPSATTTSIGTEK